MSVITMKQSSKPNRSRGKPPRKPMINIANRVYDSSGPDGKVRGTPQQIVEKYQTLARDAAMSGDRVAHENHLQHAEHYQRLILSAQSEAEERQRAGRERAEQAGRERADHGGRERSERPDRPERTDSSRHDRADHTPRHDAAKDGPKDTGSTGRAHSDPDSQPAESAPPQAQVLVIETPERRKAAAREAAAQDGCDDAPLANDAADAAAPLCDADAPAPRPRSSRASAPKTTASKPTTRRRISRTKPDDAPNEAAAD